MPKLKTPKPLRFRLARPKKSAAPQTTAPTADARCGQPGKCEANTTEGPQPEAKQDRAADPIRGFLNALFGPTANEAGVSPAAVVGRDLQTVSNCLNVIAKFGIKARAYGDNRMDESLGAICDAICKEVGGFKDTNDFIGHGHHAEVHIVRVGL